MRPVGFDGEIGEEHTRGIRSKAESLIATGCIERSQQGQRDAPIFSRRADLIHCENRSRICRLCGRIRS